MREFASDEAKDALIAWQSRQLDRLSHLAFGLPYVGPDLEDFAEDDDEDVEEEPEPPKRSTIATVESILNHEDIFRRPGRVAAPRLIERLAQAGLYLTTMEEAI